MNRQNPCLTCGACCASYRVSFYWAEIDGANGGNVPVEMTEQISPFVCAMKGTNQQAPRCAALQGAIGHNVHCLIYENRPSACRDFMISGQNGLPHNLCDRARRNWRLQPLNIPQYSVGSDRQLALTPLTMADMSIPEVSSIVN